MQGDQISSSFIHLPDPNPHDHGAHQDKMSQSSLPPWHNVLPSSPGHSAPTLPTTDQGIRICQVIQLKPEALEEYKKVHTEVFEGVLKALRRAGVVGEPLSSPGWESADITQ